MSTSIGIHNVSTIETFVRTFNMMVTTHIVVTDKAGSATEMVLYSDAPLTIPAPTRYRVGSDYRQVEEVAP